MVYGIVFIFYVFCLATRVFAETPRLPLDYDALSAGVQNQIRNEKNASVSHQPANPEGSVALPALHNSAGVTVARMTSPTLATGNVLGKDDARISQEQHSKDAADSLKGPKRDSKPLQLKQTVSGLPVLSPGLSTDKKLKENVFSSLSSYGGSSANTSTIYCRNNTACAKNELRLLPKNLSHTINRNSTAIDVARRNCSDRSVEGVSTAQRNAFLLENAVHKIKSLGQSVSINIFVSSRTTRNYDTGGGITNFDERRGSAVSEPYGFDGNQASFNPTVEPLSFKVALPTLSQAPTKNSEKNAAQQRRRRAPSLYRIPSQSRNQQVNVDITIQHNAASNNPRFAHSGSGIECISADDEDCRYQKPERLPVKNSASGCGLVQDTQRCSSPCSSHASVNSTPPTRRSKPCDCRKASSTGCGSAESSAFVQSDSPVNNGKRIDVTPCSDIQKKQFFSSTNNRKNKPCTSASPQSSTSNQSETSIKPISRLPVPIAKASATSTLRPSATLSNSDTSNGGKSDGTTSTTVARVHSKDALTVPLTTPVTPSFAARFRSTEAAISAGAPSSPFGSGSLATARSSEVSRKTSTSGATAFSPETHIVEVGPTGAATDLNKVLPSDAPFSNAANIHPFTTLASSSTRDSAPLSEAKTKATFDLLKSQTAEESTLLKTPIIVGKGVLSTEALYTTVKREHTEMRGLTSSSLLASDCMSDMTTTDERFRFWMEQECLKRRRQKQKSGSSTTPRPTLVETERCDASKLSSDACNTRGKISPTTHTQTKQGKIWNTAETILSVTEPTDKNSGKPEPTAPADIFSTTTPPISLATQDIATPGKHTSKATQYSSTTFQPFVESKFASETTASSPDPTYDESVISKLVTVSPQPEFTQKTHRKHSARIHSNAGTRCSRPSNVAKRTLATVSSSTATLSSPGTATSALPKSSHSWENQKTSVDTSTVHYSKSEGMRFTSMSPETASPDVTMWVSTTKPSELTASNAILNTKTLGQTHPAIVSITSTEIPPTREHLASTVFFPVANTQFSSKTVRLPTTAQLSTDGMTLATIRVPNDSTETKRTPPGRTEVPGTSTGSTPSLFSTTTKEGTDFLVVESLTGSTSAPPRFPSTTFSAAPVSTSLQSNSKLSSLTSPRPSLVSSSGNNVSTFSGATLEPSSVTTSFNTAPEKTFVITQDTSNGGSAPVSTLLRSTSLFSPSISNTQSVFKFTTLHTANTLALTDKLMSTSSTEVPYAKVETTSMPENSVSSASSFLLSSSSFPVTVSRASRAPPISVSSTSLGSTVFPAPTTAAIVASEKNDPATVSPTSSTVTSFPPPASKGSPWPLPSSKSVPEAPFSPKTVQAYSSTVGPLVPTANTYETTQEKKSPTLWQSLKKQESTVARPQHEAETKINVASSTVQKEKQISKVTHTIEKSIVPSTISASTSMRRRDWNEQNCRSRKRKARFQTSTKSPFTATTVEEALTRGTSENPAQTFSMPPTSIPPGETTTKSAASSPVTFSRKMNRVTPTAFISTSYSSSSSTNKSLNPLHTAGPSASTNSMANTDIPNETLQQSLTGSVVATGKPSRQTSQTARTTTSSNLLSVLETQTVSIDSSTVHLVGKPSTNVQPSLSPMTTSAVLNTDSSATGYRTKPLSSSAYSSRTRATTTETLPTSEINPKTTYDAEFTTHNHRATDERYVTSIKTSNPAFSGSTVLYTTSIVTATGEFDTTSAIGTEKSATTAVDSTRAALSTNSIVTPTFANTIFSKAIVEITETGPNPVITKRQIEQSSSVTTAHVLPSTASVLSRPSTLLLSPDSTMTRSRSINSFTGHEGRSTSESQTINTKVDTATHSETQFSERRMSIPNKYTESIVGRQDKDGTSTSGVVVAKTRIETVRSASTGHRLTSTPFDWNEQNCSNLTHPLQPCTLSPRVTKPQKVSQSSVSTKKKPLCKTRKTIPAVATSTVVPVATKHPGVTSSTLRTAYNDDSTTIYVMGTQSESPYVSTTLTASIRPFVGLFETTDSPVSSTIVESSASSKTVSKETKPLLSTSGEILTGYDFSSSSTLPVPVPIQTPKTTISHVRSTASEATVVSTPYKDFSVGSTPESSTTAPLNTALPRTQTLATARFNSPSATHHPVGSPSTSSKAEVPNSSTVGLPPQTFTSIGTISEFSTVSENTNSALTKHSSTILRKTSNNNMQSSTVTDALNTGTTTPKTSTSTVSYDLFSSTELKLPRTKPSLSTTAIHSHLETTAGSGVWTSEAPTAGFGTTIGPQSTLQFTQSKKQTSSQLTLVENSQVTHSVVPLSTTNVSSTTPNSDSVSTLRNRIPKHIGEQECRERARRRKAQKSSSTTLSPLVSTNSNSFSSVDHFSTSSGASGPQSSTQPSATSGDTTACTDSYSTSEPVSQSSSVTTQQSSWPTTLDSRHSFLPTSAITNPLIARNTATLVSQPTASSPTTEAASTSHSTVISTDIPLHETSSSWTHRADVSSKFTTSTSPFSTVHEGDNKTSPSVSPPTLVTPLFTTISNFSTRKRSSSQSVNGYSTAPKNAYKSKPRESTLTQENSDPGATSHKTMNPTTKDQSQIPLLSTVPTIALSTSEITTAFTTGAIEFSNREEGSTQTKENPFSKPTVLPETTATRTVSTQRAQSQPETTFMGSTSSIGEKVFSTPALTTKLSTEGFTTTTKTTTVTLTRQHDHDTTAASSTNYSYLWGEQECLAAGYTLDACRRRSSTKPPVTSFQSGTSISTSASTTIPTSSITSVSDETTLPEETNSHESVSTHGRKRSVWTTDATAAKSELAFSSSTNQFSHPPDTTDNASTIRGSSFVGVSRSESTRIVQQSSTSDNLASSSFIGASASVESILHTGKLVSVVLVTRASDKNFLLWLLAPTALPQTTSSIDLNSLSTVTAGASRSAFTLPASPSLPHHVTNANAESSATKEPLKSSRFVTQQRSQAASSLGAATATAAGPNSRAATPGTAVSTRHPFYWGEQQCFTASYENNWCRFISSTSSQKNTTILSAAATSFVTRQGKNDRLMPEKFPLLNEHISTATPPLSVLQTEAMLPSTLFDEDGGVSQGKVTADRHSPKPETDDAGSRSGSFVTKRDTTPSNDGLVHKQDKFFRDSTSSPTGVTQIPTTGANGVTSTLIPRHTTSTTFAPLSTSTENILVEKFTQKTQVPGFQSFETTSLKDLSSSEVSKTQDVSTSSTEISVGGFTQRTRLPWTRSSETTFLPEAFKTQNITTSSTEIPVEDSTKETRVPRFSSFTTSSEKPSLSKTFETQDAINTATNISVEDFTHAQKTKAIESPEKLVAASPSTGINQAGTIEPSAAPIDITPSPQKPLISGTAANTNETMPIPMPASDRHITTVPATDASSPNIKTPLPSLSILTEAISAEDSTQGTQIPRQPKFEATSLQTASSLEISKTQDVSTASTNNSVNESTQVDENETSKNTTESVPASQSDEISQAVALETTAAFKGVAPEPQEASTLGAPTDASTIIPSPMQRSNGQVTALVATGATPLYTNTPLPSLSTSTEAILAENSTQGTQVPWLPSLPTTSLKPEASATLDVTNTATKVYDTTQAKRIRSINYSDEAFQRTPEVPSSPKMSQTLQSVKLTPKPPQLSRTVVTEARDSSLRTDREFFTESTDLTAEGSTQATASSVVSEKLPHPAALVDSNPSAENSQKVERISVEKTTTQKPGAGVDIDNDTLPGISTTTDTPTSESQQAGASVNTASERPLPSEMESSTAVFLHKSKQ